MMMRFETPWVLLALLLPLFYGWWRQRRRQRAGVNFSSLAQAAKVQPSLRRALVWVPAFLRLSAWVLLVVAIARPQAGREQIHDISQGIAIEMVLDRSGSMNQEMEYAGQRLNRFETVKRIFAAFVFGDRKLELLGRPNDLVGMITFARYPDTICPLTLGHGALRTFLETVDIVSQESEDGTAIGDAVTLAAARLHTAAETVARQTGRHAEDYQITSKVIILLTDGENNCGKRTLAEAGELATKWGIKVYCIGVGGGEGVRVMNTVFGNIRVGSGNQPFDPRPLEELAARTGGAFRMATDSASLLKIYQEIDSMEKSDVESIRFVDYRELFTQFALAALACLVLQLLLESTVFRRIP